MDIAILQSTESLELVNFHLKHNVGIRIDGLKRRLSKAYHLIILFHTIELDPLDMVLNRVGMRNLFPYDNSDAAGTFNFDNGNVFLFALILGALKEICKFHSIFSFILYFPSIYYNLKPMSIIPSSSNEVIAISGFLLTS